MTLDPVTFGLPASTTTQPLAVAPSSGSADARAMPTTLSPGTIAKGSVAVPSWRQEWHPHTHGPWGWAQGRGHTVSGLKRHKKNVFQWHTLSLQGKGKIWSNMIYLFNLWMNVFQNLTCTISILSVIVDINKLNRSVESWCPSCIILFISFLQGWKKYPIFILE